MTRLDEETLQRVQRRDSAALETFFETYVDRVHAYVHTLLRGADNVDDIIQTSFLAMHRAIDRLDPRRDPSPWVFTIVTNVLRDFWRSREYRMRGAHVNLDDLWDVAPAGIETIEETMVRTEESARVLAALGRLSPADRQIIWLRTYEELEVSSVAEALGITPEAVRQRHSRAVKRLTREFHEPTSSLATPEPSHD